MSIFFFDVKYKHYIETNCKLHSLRERANKFKTEKIEVDKEVDTKLTKENLH